MNIKIFLATLLISTAAWAQKPVALLIGDSQAGGMRSEFVKQASNAGYKPVVHFVGGTMTSQWLSKLPKDMKENKPDLVIVVLGTNDAGMTPGMLRERQDMYRKLVDIVARGEAAIGWIGIPKLHPRLKLAEQVKEKIREASPNVFDSSLIDIPMQRDAVHATPAGYVRWFDEAWYWFADAGVVSYCGPP